MPLKPRRSIPRRDDVLTGPLSDDARWYLNTGFHLDGSEVRLDLDPDRAKRLWVRHRAELLAGYRGPGSEGKRPWALYRFDFGLQFVPRNQAEFLREAGLLEAWELVALDKVGGSSEE